MRSSLLRSMILGAPAAVLAACASTEAPSGSIDADNDAGFVDPMDCGDFQDGERIEMRTIPTHVPCCKPAKFVAIVEPGSPMERWGCMKLCDTAGLATTWACASRREGERLVASCRLACRWDEVPRDGGASDGAFDASEAGACAPILGSGRMCGGWFRYASYPCGLPSSVLAYAADAGIPGDAPPTWSPAARNECLDFTEGQCEICGKCTTCMGFASPTVTVACYDPWGCE